MKITASIVLYKTSDNEIKKVLKSIFDSAIPNFKLYLIDNSPTNYLKKYQSFNKKIEYIFTGKNLGYGPAHNIALKKAIEKKSKYHYILNPDIYFKEETLIKLVNYMENNHEIGQLMPKIVYPDGSLQYLCKLIPSPIDLIIRRFLPPSLYKKRRKIYQLEFTGYNSIMEVPYLSGCFMLLRVESLLNVGLFDEGFFMYPEDIDLTRRITEKYKTIYYPEITVVHNHAKDSYNDLKMLWVHINNIIKYFNKWGWIFDKKRKIINREVLKKLNYYE